MPSLKLMKSYLTNRYQRVKLNNRCSLSELIKYGVPQGQISGPALFNICSSGLLFFTIGDVDAASYAMKILHKDMENIQIRFWKNLNLHQEIYLNGPLLTQL